MQPVSIDPEFQICIPPLTGEERQQLEANMLGFEGFNAEGTHYIGISPSVALGYWFVSMIDLVLGIEEFTKKPLRAHRIARLVAKSGIDTFEPIVCSPLPVDFYTRPTNPIASKKSFRTNVYIIQADIGGPVKIGFSQDIESRLALFQVGCPFRLTIVKTFEDVPARVEKQLHQRFAAFRLHGEWFSEAILRLLTDEVFYED